MAKCDLITTTRSLTHGFSELIVNSVADVKK